MVRTVAYTGERWPLEMRAETAAEYCDEVSIESFHSKVAKGIYPQPSRQPGMLPKWHRGKLDAAIAERHGLQPAAPGEVIEDVTALIG
jgi:hypothetical protein